MTSPHFTARTCPTCRGGMIYDDDIPHPCDDCEIRGWLVDPAKVPMLLPYGDPCPCDGEHGPDPDWLALDQPCDTVGETHIGRTGRCDQDQPCIDGRRTIPIYLHGDILHATATLPAIEGAKRLVGRASVTLAPVHDRLVDERPSISIADGTVTLWHEGRPGWPYEQGTILNIDVKPGDLVAIPDRIEET